jgi:hypothetical protein
MSFECESRVNRAVYDIFIESKESMLTISEGGNTIYKGKVTNFIADPRWVTDKFGQTINQPVYSVLSIGWGGGYISTSDPAGRSYFMMFKGDVSDCIANRNENN